MIKLLWTGGWDSTFRLLQLVAELNVRLNLVLPPTHIEPALRDL